MALRFNPFTGTLDIVGSTAAPTPSNSFTIIQTDAGTSPTATSSTDTLTFTSSDGSILITGDSTTDTVDFTVVPDADMVQGPASATDNALARFDGTTGKLIQNSTASLDDSGNLTLSGTFLPGKATYEAIVALTDGANIATDASLGNIFTVTLAGNRTLDNPTNPVSGQKCIWRIRQDATGSRTLTLGAAFRFGADIPVLNLSTTASKTDYIGAIYHATDSKWDIVAFATGY